MITATDFVTIPTEDIEATVAFYRDTLGLHRSVHMPERGFAEFETGNLTLSVIVPSKMGMEPYVSNNTIALRVDDMQAARAELEAKGVTFGADTFDTGVCHMAFFRDNNGNPLMLHHRYTPRETE
jgi:catechol 2,3-dioxygenase-like lactoylglutathione lyase family enzyme